MIRHADDRDIPRLLEIYSLAKTFMHTNGNPNQWSGAYPDKSTLEGDIREGNLYAMFDSDERVYGCFALIGGEDAAYSYIDGSWTSDLPYGTIHRIASDGTKRGIMRECFDFARLEYSHLRVDTHKDNKPMQKAVLACGFGYRGVIYLSDGSPRLAYDWIE